MCPESQELPYALSCHGCSFLGLTVGCLLRACEGQPRDTPTMVWGAPRQDH